MRTEKEIMSGMNMHYVRVPLPQKVPISPDDIDTIEHDHPGVWIETIDTATSVPGTATGTRVFTATTQRGEARLSIVFDELPSLHQVRTAARGLLTLRKQLEELER